jgi:hypothetical protein
MREKRYAFRKTLIVGFLVICLCVLTLYGVSTFLIRDRNGDPANLNTAARITQEFLASIHDRDIKSAHSMLSEKFYPPVTEGQFAELLHKDENIFHAYTNWEICDWGIFISDGPVIDTEGLLYYDGRKIVVQISLHKDSDSIWRIQGFRFRPDIEPVPFGLCQ